MTSREVVQRTLTFQTPPRIPRQLWSLPWGHKYMAEGIAEMQRRWPSDFDGAPGVYTPSSRVKGDPFDVGHFTDEWGCTFENIHWGVIGEVKEPQIADLANWKSVKPPYECLPTNLTEARDKVNRAYAASSKFMQSGCCPRPWERLQFIRGTVNAMMDVVEGTDEFKRLLETIHSFYMKELEFWMSTDVDAAFFMDDWGSQNALLISPDMWREYFKPLYKDYCDLAHANGKFAFMHSDGHISAVYEDLVEIGVNAVNSQLFCMDMADLAKRVKGKITFWGEIDRQHVLVSANPEDGRKAVRKVAQHLYDPKGGIIAQFEVGAGCHAATAIAVFEEWDKVESGQ